MDTDGKIMAFCLTILLIFTAFALHACKDSDNRDYSCEKNGGKAISFDSRSIYDKCVKNGLLIDPYTGEPL